MIIHIVNVIDLMIYDAIKLNISLGNYNFLFPYVVADLYLTTYRCVFGTSSELAGVFAIGM